MSRDASRELADLQSHDDVVARIYADQLPSEIRELALALAWTNLRDPARHDPSAGGALRRAAMLLGRDEAGTWRHMLALAADAPRYEVPTALQRKGICEAPRLRPHRPRQNAKPDSATFWSIADTPHGAAHRGPHDGRLCGAVGTISVDERDLGTGHVLRRRWYCRRHRDHAGQAQSQIAAGGDAPDPPVPNCGGWLPRYFQPEPFERLYRRARPGWTPPAVGLCRDDWAKSSVTLQSRRSRLALVVST